MKFISTCRALVDLSDFFIVRGSSMFERIGSDTRWGNMTPQNLQCLGMYRLEHFNVIDDDEFASVSQRVEVLGFPVRLPHLSHAAERICSQKLNSSM